MIASLFKYSQISFFVKLALILPLSLILTLLLRNKSYALSWTYPEYNVDISIQENTVFKVQESASFQYTGELNGLRRDIRLNNPEKEATCAESPEFTCGGFEFLTFDKLIYNGKEQKENEFKLYEVTKEDTEEKFFRIEKRVYEPAKSVINELHEWTFSYDIYGGIQWLENSQGNEVPFFYWNLLPEDRGGLTSSSTIRIQFPDNVIIDKNKFVLYPYSYSELDYEYEIEDSSNTVILNFENLSSYENVTLSYEFNPTDLIKPGTISYNLVNPVFGVKTKIDGREFKANQSNEFKYFPAGEYTISFVREGYESFEKRIEVTSDKPVSISSITLTPTPPMSLANSLLYVLTLIGIAAIPVLLRKAYKDYKIKGTDKQKPKTIIPLFTPPEKVHPYLLGSLKDEKVDQRDITGTLIDLAYRGFIKIKEEESNKYLLTRLDGKKGEVLNAIEQKLMDYLFGGNTEVRTTDLTYSSFGSKLPGLKKEIYQEMVSNGWFEESPESTRNKYLGIGIGIFILGSILGIGVSILATYLTGVLTFFTLGAAVTLYGLVRIITSSSMPAKTPKGSKVYAEVLGFKMYMDTAERYRVQGLDPEEFVKFLSYAIVFGIEAKWAETFKDIYTTQPDWYEGSSITAWDVWTIDRMSRGFMQSTEVSMTPVSASSGSSSGSGWSGGGSFGGFSGGGGGGGSSGGW